MASFSSKASISHCDDQTFLQSPFSAIYQVGNIIAYSFCSSSFCPLVNRKYRKLYRLLQRQLICTLQDSWSHSPSNILQYIFPSPKISKSPAFANYFSVQEFYLSLFSSFMTTETNQINADTILNYNRLRKRLIFTSVVSFPSSCAITWQSAGCHRFSSCIIR